MALRSAISVGRRANLGAISAKSFLNTPKTFLNHPHFSFPNHVTKSGYSYSIRAIQGTSVEPISLKVDEKEKQNGGQNWQVKMLYDGDCPLCMREVNMLQERNKKYNGAIKFVDISSDDYSPEDNQGLDYMTAMGRIHAVLSDGTVVKDVEAFRKLYEAVGLGWIYAITKYEPVASIADAVYGVWAKYRLQITGRPPMEEILKSRTKKGGMCNDSDTCKM
ncbi:hypothetical protein RND81_02G025900 [Saponaria officinalis]|uniref:Thiol-disulfide oxidoreductase DCC n=1 Tax=Saponaria officinalis TaxID=3572 RepID=A0AAW1MUR2_SAPOF